MRVIIIGAGIGGLSTALSLLKAGVGVEIYEASPRLVEIGAGLQVSANAVRVLQELGLEPALAEIGIVSEGFELRDLRTHALLNYCPLGEAAAERYGARLYQVHRGDLQRILLHAVPPEIIHLGYRCTGCSETPEGITAEFDNRGPVRGDALIGADGIHSVIRQQFLGVDDVEFSGIVALRCLVPAVRIAHLGLPYKTTGWLGPGRSAVAYFCRSGELLNFVGVVPWPDKEAESWTTLGEVTSLRAAYADANDVLKRLLMEIDETFITGYFVREPLPSWSHGRATILGDAAHPMHPYLAQGACQAIEDAFTVSECLTRHGTGRVRQALQEYEQRRYRRASEVQTASKTGERVWNMSDPTELRIRNGQFKSLETLDPFAQTVWSWVYEHDPVGSARAPLRSPAEAALQREEARRAWTLWNKMLSPEDLGKGRQGMRAAYERFLLGNVPMLAGTTLEEIAAGGVPSLMVRSSEKPASGLVLLFHGGGYSMGSAKSSVGLASRIAAAMDRTCMVVDYRLAPEYPYPAALHDDLAAYSWLLEHGIDPAEIVVVGESAGGGLALSTALALRDQGLPLPAALVVISPFVDLSISGESVDQRAAYEPIARRKLLVQWAAAYLQGHDPADPLVSPIFADLTGLPPLLIQVAENEALFSDALRLAERARRCGVRVELERYPDSVHSFPLFDFLPEAKVALTSAATFAGSCVRNRDTSQVN